MAKTRWEQVYQGLWGGSPLPAWTTQDDVLRALAELAADQECGLITTARVWQLLPEWRAAAVRYRCLEAYEPLEAAAVRGVTLEELLAHQQRCLTYAAGRTGRGGYDLTWLAGAVTQKCEQVGIAYNSADYDEALSRAVGGKRAAAGRLRGNA